ncbi:MAG TPA: DUF192 domain-containing protein [Candidatus Saccharimonadales bacterium]|nr:DUF192 domain-containing protein [Candidatus Saccharimonadales bacterium]
MIFALISLEIPAGHRIHAAYCNSLKPISRLRCSVNLEYVTTPRERALGLSGRPSMPMDKGMLFVFERPGRQCMWMKDMNFSLDMIWLSPDRRVLRIVRNLSPDSYPKSFCADDTSYVIELNSGVSDQLGLRIGDYTEL